MYERTTQMSKEYERMAKMLAFRSAILKHNVVVKNNTLGRIGPGGMGYMHGGLYGGRVQILDQKFRYGSMLD